MKKFPSKNRLGRIMVHNSHNLASLSERKLFIGYSPTSRGSAYRAAHYSIIHIGFRNDPSGHWQNYGNKTFDISLGKTKEDALNLAVEWANKKYGTKEWVRDPFGGYQIPEVLELAWEKVRAKESEEL